MSHFSLRPSLQRGVTLTETLLVLALASVLAAAAYRAYASASNDAKLSDMSNGTLSLIGKIKQVWGSAGNYENLTPTTLNRSGILPSQFKFAPGGGSGGNDQVWDTFGNEVLISGTRGSFALVFGYLSKDNCSSLAPTLASIAYRINVGEGATASNGKISGGKLYKGPEVSTANNADLGNNNDLDTDALVTACSGSGNRVIALEIR